MCAIRENLGEPVTTQDSPQKHRRFNRPPGTTLPTNLELRLDLSGLELDFADMRKHLMGAIHIVVRAWMLRIVHANERSVANRGALLQTVRTS